MAEICIFPIPGCVTFPGTVFPLHVFEPRYREMIQRCLDENKLVAICHPSSVALYEQTGKGRDLVTAGVAGFCAVDKVVTETDQLHLLSP